MNNNIYDLLQPRRRDRQCGPQSTFLCLQMGDTWGRNYTMRITYEYVRNMIHHCQRYVKSGNNERSHQVNENDGTNNKQYHVIINSPRDRARLGGPARRPWGVIWHIFRSLQFYLSCTFKKTTTRLRGRHYETHAVLMINLSNNKRCRFYYVCLSNQSRRETEWLRMVVVQRVPRKLDRLAGCPSPGPLGSGDWQAPSELGLYTIGWPPPQAHDRGNEWDPLSFKHVRRELSSHWQQPIPKMRLCLRGGTGCHSLRPSKGTGKFVTARHDQLHTAQPP